MLVHTPLILAAATVLVLFYRRPDQFFNPYLWVEDGRVNLPEFLSRGWSMVIEPIVGYISIPMRAAFALAASVSLRWLPELLMAMAVLSTVLVVLAVARAPTLLRHRTACAFAVLLLPTGVEVFGVSLYIGWWMTVLAILPLFWQPDAANWRTLRPLMILAGGLSTPLIIALWPLYAIRAACWRRSGELVALAIASVAAIWQALTIAGVGTAVSVERLWQLADITLFKFFGLYLFWSEALPYPSFFIAPGFVLCLLLLIGSIIVFRRSRADAVTISLLAILVALCIAASVVRADPTEMHPILAGPRYFFLPYIGIGWMLIQIVSAGPHWLRAACGCVIAVTVANCLVNGRARHEFYEWRTELDRCLASEQHRFPILYEGYASHGIVWQVGISGDQCRNALGVTGGVIARAPVPAPEPAAQDRPDRMNPSTLGFESQ